MNLISYKSSDAIGAFASFLCMLHCFATPFLFIAVAGTAGGEEAPLWWLSVNYLFLFISFFAVLHSAQTTSRPVMRPLFWLNWIILTFVVVNEQFGWMELAEAVTYAAAFALVGLHLFNRAYGTSNTEDCNVDHE
ncbi:MAG: MerC domain-containing protein [Bacteroidota bacterium]